MGIRIIEGSIIDAKQDIIVQQVNCMGYMGAGLARTIYQKYPEVKESYHNAQKKMLALRHYENENLLGLVHYVDTHGQHIVANVFGQVDIRQGRHDKRVHTVKEALFEGIDSIKQVAKAHDLTIAIPTHIGCGLAGGNWETIKKGIEKIFEGEEHLVVFYHYR